MHSSPCNRSHTLGHSVEPTYAHIRYSARANLAKSWSSLGRSPAWFGLNNLLRISGAHLHACEPHYKFRLPRRARLPGLLRFKRGPARGTQRAMVTANGNSPAALDLTLSALKKAYAEGLTPTKLVDALYDTWTAADSVFITLASKGDLLARARELEALPEEQRGALHGVPFAVKDNIDVAGFPTTAACKDFLYHPGATATVVQPLLAAGGIMVGKTNMDQFAAGLVGTRTPYGVAKNAFDARFVPGGSSSGSGAIIGARLLTFALGTDTAGSGRIPAMFNGCVGIKPTPGKLSTLGVVPACKSLDCVSVFAQSVEDAAAAARIMESGSAGLEDPTWQPPGAAVGRRFQAGQRFRFAVPGPEFTTFAGPGGDSVAAGYAALFEEAAARFEALGGTRMADFDFAPFATTAAMLYETAFLAERYAGVKSFLHAKPAQTIHEDHANGTAANGTASNGTASNGTAHSSSRNSSSKSATNGFKEAKVEPQGPLPHLTPEDILADGRLERVTRAIIAGACGRTAVDLYGDLDRLRVLKAKARTQMAKVDFLLVPTAAHHYTIEEILSQEEAPGKVSWGYNANLGRFTNFVNLMEMAGIAIPSGLLRCSADGSDEAGKARRAHLAETGAAAPVLPFGITLLGAAWTDEYLWGVAEQYCRATGLKCGRVGHGLT